MEPFKGKKPAQVIKAVLFSEERPKIPQGASASPDVVPLMEQCWMQDPAWRPEGFVPVVQGLASVVKRVGDPRNHRSAAEDFTSTGVKRSGDALSVGASTAPVTVGGSLDASPLESVSVKESMAATTPPVLSPPVQEVRVNRVFIQQANATPPKLNDTRSSAEATTPRRSLGKYHAPAETVPVPAPRVQDASTDRAALMALYSSTNGPPEKSELFGLVNKGGWKDRKGWGTSRPIRKWHGVTVDYKGRVIKLELGGNNLRGGYHGGTCRVGIEPNTAMRG